MGVSAVQRQGTGHDSASDQGRQPVASTRPTSERPALLLSAGTWVAHAQQCLARRLTQNPRST
eukprot:14394617-Alexandrium_andersonii.AAC.1